MTHTQKYKYGTMAAIGLSLVFFQAMPANAQNKFIQPHQEMAMSTAQPKLNTINIVDKSLQVTHQLKKGGTHTSGKFAVDNVGLKSTATFLPEVWAQLRNLTDYPQNILVRTTWYDKNEMPVDGPTMWDHIAFAPNGGEIYRSKSIHPDAESFYIEVRETPK